MPTATDVKFGQRGKSNSFISPFSGSTPASLYSSIPLSAGNQPGTCLPCAMLGRSHEEIERMIAQESELDARIKPSGVSLQDSSSVSTVKFPPPLPVGQGSVYLGFTAGSRFGNSHHRIHDFQFSSVLNFYQHKSWDLFEQGKLILSGDARLEPGILNLQMAELAGGLGEVATPKQAGSMFLSTPVSIFVKYGETWLLPEFSAKFIFSMGGTPYRGDGLTFVISANPDIFLGPNDEWEPLGAGMGYSGLDKSVAIGFDTVDNEQAWEPGDNHVEIDADGSVESLASVEIPKETLDLCGDTEEIQLRYVWVDWDFSGSLLNVYLSRENVKPETPTLTHEINLTSYLITE